MKAADAGWLTPVRETLEKLKVPRQLFFRDDDAGWADQQLYKLLDVFAHASTPVDLAVIPNCLTNELTYALQARCAAQALGLHQHGFQHANHAQVGRKCEFGGDRSWAQQYTDINEGRGQLTRAFGAMFDPVFTPPWNRCSSTTIDCLVELRFQVLSRDRSAELLDPQTVIEIPVDIDWCRFADPTLRGYALANAINNNHCVGVMLHHAAMSTDCLRTLRDLLLLLARYPQVQCCRLRDLLAQVMYESDKP